MSDSFATPRTVARQAPLSMGFSRQEYWSGVPLPSPNLNLIMRGKKKTPSKRKLKDSRENNWPVLIKKCHWHERLDRTKLSQVRGDWGGVKIKCYVVSRTSGGLVTKSCLTLVTPWTEPTRLLCLWVFPGKTIGMGCHFLLQGIFPTQGLNPSLLHWQVDSLPLSHQGSPVNQLSSSIK